MSSTLGRGTCPGLDTPDASVMLDTDDGMLSLGVEIDKGGLLLELFPSDNGGEAILATGTGCFKFEP